LTEAPVTQTVRAVVEMLNFLRKPANPLPEVVELPGMALILSNKKDVYYATSANSCSCPAAGYHPGQLCKHSRKYFPQPKREVALPEIVDSIKPTGKWPGGFNGPIDNEKGALTHAL
jgi:hypothetical protein